MTTHMPPSTTASPQAISRSKLGTTTAPFYFLHLSWVLGAWVLHSLQRHWRPKCAVPSALSGLWFSAVCHAPHPHDILPQAPCSFLSHPAPALPISTPTLNKCPHFPQHSPHFFSRCFSTPRLSLLLKTQFPLTTLSLEKSVYLVITSITYNPRSGTRWGTHAFILQPIISIIPPLF